MSDTIEISLIERNTQKCKLILNNNTTEENINNVINKLEELLIKNCDLIIFILHNSTTNFHKYEFEFTGKSKLFPRKWLLNNILYSLTCDKTQTNMTSLFNNIINKLFFEYNSC